MLRIVSGYLGGRQIEQPKTDKVRPMSEKVRAALFDSLGDVTGLAVLDAYAGSGAIGLEALSRGANPVLALESNPKVASVIQANSDKLDAGPGYKVITQSVESWLGKAASIKFNIIIADPPYSELKANTLDGLSEHLTTEGVLVVSHAGKLAPPELQSYALLRSRRYGDSALSYYQPTVK